MNPQSLLLQIKEHVLSERLKLPLLVYIDETLTDGNHCYIQQPHKDRVYVSKQFYDYLKQNAIDGNYPLNV